MPDGAFTLFKTFAHLEDGPGASEVAVGERFWEEIGGRADLQEGRLVTAFHWEEDWPNWERHPAGDEIVFVLWGRAELVLEEDGGERVVALPSGHACIVPRGVWHTARVPEPTNALAITRGAGTEHRPAAG